MTEKTVKLSTVLANLQHKQGSTDDHIIISSDGSNRYVNPTDLPTANTSQNGLMSAATYNTLATQVTRIDEINTRLSTLNGRYFAHSNCETIAAFNEKLNAMNNDSQQGVHVLPIFGIPMVVTNACNKVDQSVWVQTLSGCVSLTDDAKSVKDAGSYLSFVQYVRYYNENGGKAGWSAWKKVVPTLQDGASGDETNYVYSKGDAGNKSVLSGACKAFQNNGDCLLRFAIWGGSISDDSKTFKTLKMPEVSSSANGVLNRNYFTRLINTSLSEGSSTAKEVRVNYPDYSNGGTKTLTLTSATSAKAGIMTAATYNTISTSVQRLSDIDAKVNQASYVMNEAYLPTKESGSVVAANKEAYIRMAKAISYGGYVAIRKEAEQSDRIYGYYYFPIEQAQAKYTDDNNFKVSFAYKGSIYKVQCVSGTLSNTIEADTDSLYARIKALEARVAALENDTNTYLTIK